jgi:broad specificity phosphatase PhoE
MTETDDRESCLAYLVRHGATDANLANPPILQGRSIDGPLSATGVDQATAVARCLASFRISAVYSSPLRRARETAEQIAGKHGLPIQLVEDLTEVDVGAWERRSWLEISQTERDAYERFQSDPATHGYRDGEDLRQVRDRVVPALDRIMEQHLGTRVVVVAHNVVNRVLLAETLAIPLSQARILAQHNCGINVLQRRNGVTATISLNSVFHLL